MIRQFKYYYHQNKLRLKIQLLVSFLVVTIFAGQAGQSLSVFSGRITKLSWNPLILLYYAWIKMFIVSIGILVILNIVIIYVIINMNDKYYDKERNFQISEKGTLGTGGFMRLEDKQNALIMDSVDKIDGDILGKDQDSDLICSPKKTLYLNGHKVVCGGSGARKTTTQAFNDLFQIVKRNESFIVTDPKAEIVGKMRKLVENRGYVVKTLNLVNLVNSDAVDFLKCLRDEDGNRDIEVQNAMTLSRVIMSNTTEDVTGGFWDDCQQGLLLAAILYVMYDETGNTNPTLAAAYELILKNDKQELDRLFNNLDKDHPSKAAYLLYAKTDAKVRDSVIIGLMMRLQVFSSETVKRIVSEDEIDITLPAKQKCAYFLVMSDQEHTYDFISSLFFSVYFIREVKYIDSLPTRYADVPVNLIMDEFPSIGTIPDFSRKLATLRSRKIFITIIFQNFGQIIDKYEKNDWQTIVSNCDTNIYLGGNDIKETAEFYSERLGEMTVVAQGKRTTQKLLSVTDNKFHPSYMVTESESSRPVMTKEELMRLPLDEAIVFLKSCRPLKVNKFVYTEHPMSQEMIDINATTHFPQWRKRQEGYPDVDDEILFPVIEHLKKQGELKKYEAEHKRNKKYTLTHFLKDTENEMYYEIIKVLDEKEEVFEKVNHQETDITKDIEHTVQNDKTSTLSDNGKGNGKESSGKTGIKKYTPLAKKQQVDEKKAVVSESGPRFKKIEPNKVETKTTPLQAKEDATNNANPTNQKEHLNHESAMVKQNDKMLQNVSHETFDDKNKAIKQFDGPAASDVASDVPAASDVNSDKPAACDNNDSSNGNDRNERVDTNGCGIAPLILNDQDKISHKTVEPVPTLSAAPVSNTKDNLDVKVEKPSGEKDDDEIEPSIFLFKLPEAKGEDIKADDLLPELQEESGEEIPGFDDKDKTIEKEVVLNEKSEAPVVKEMSRDNFQLFGDDGDSEFEFSMESTPIKDKIGMKRNADKKKKGFTKANPKNF